MKIDVETNQLITNNMRRLNSRFSAQFAFKQHRETGGSTVMNMGHGHSIPSEGYVVGGLIPETIIPIEIHCHSKDLFLLLWKSYSKLCNINQCIGTWENKEGSLVFDISQVVESEHEARALAFLRGEDSYYDLNLNQTTYLDEVHD